MSAASSEISNQELNDLLVDAEGIQFAIEWAQRYAKLSKAGKAAWEKDRTKHLARALHNCFKGTQTQTLWRKDNPEAALERVQLLREGYLRWREQNPEKAAEKDAKAGAALLQWKKEHPEDVRLNAEGALIAMRKAHAIWRQEHPEEAKAFYAQCAQGLILWKKRNPEKVMEQARAGLEAIQRWGLDHPEKARKIAAINVENFKKWRAEYPEECKAQIAKRTEASRAWSREHPEECRRSADVLIQWQIDNPLERKKHQLMAVAARQRRRQEHPEVEKEIKHKIGLRSDNASGFKGVHWSRSSALWFAQITIDGKAKHLGGFEFKEEAANAYNQAALKYFGSHAYQNPIAECWIKPVEEPLSTIITNHKSGVRKRSVSGFKGVTWHKGKRKWCAAIASKGQQIYLGRFENKEEAAMAYNAAALEYFGPHAYQNPIPGGSTCPVGAF